VLQLIRGYEQVVNLSMGTHRAEDDAGQAQKGGKADAKGIWGGHGGSFGLSRRKNHPQNACERLI
jgi:hypothetical protein